MSKLGNGEGAVVPMIMKGPEGRVVLQAAGGSSHTPNRRQAFPPCLPRIEALPELDLLLSALSLKFGP